ncbi:uncharacterized protein SCHCODRAFT_02017835 [Schizophyllum commune H4-8]|uniref:uncharacterized protein n=1 Tax=Schizophyllum commune (strain H4-8 / FGSC 9210) TaxID=578458 RepID=UPI0021609285|nr:uncharacterized protein SCHCODRAFT_02017835 [Schizophyllum commune H4-8]KAI5899688.1 hypothetical protein SCHCODRAFT_02017835 [Schizophyllum commune H4-8]
MTSLHPCLGFLAARGSHCPNPMSTRSQPDPSQGGAQPIYLIVWQSLELLLIFLLFSVLSSPRTLCSHLQRTVQRKFLRMNHSNERLRRQ